MIITKLFEDTKKLDSKTRDTIIYLLPYMFLHTFTSVSVPDPQSGGELQKIKKD